MDEQGVRFQPPLGGTLSLGKTNAFFLGGGRGALNDLYRRAEKLGVSVIYDSPVIALNIDDGFFISAVIKRANKQIPIRGKALVAACRRLRGQYRMVEGALGRGGRQFPHPWHAL